MADRLRSEKGTLRSSKTINSTKVASKKRLTGPLNWCSQVACLCGIGRIAAIRGNHEVEPFHTRRDHIAGQMTQPLIFQNFEDVVTVHSQDLGQDDGFQEDEIPREALSEMLL